MNYYLTRNGQQFGPYSLADLQRYLASGHIVPTDLVRSEAMADWAPVQEVVGTVPVASAPPPTSYGQIPNYGAPGVYPPTGAARGVALPPDMPWWLVLLLGLVTCGVFFWAWMFVEAVAVKRMDRGSKAVLYYGLGLGLTLVGVLLSGPPDTRALGTLTQLAGLVLMVMGHFNIKGSMETYFNREEPIHLQLNGVMVFFFNVIYFQYHFNRIQRWRSTGVLS
jgi:hypothetical protein